MNSGGIESGETAPQAALREIREETGLIPQALYSADAVETFYMQSNDKITFVPVFVAFVENLKVSLSPKEHDAYEWLSFENARDRLAWSEQRRVICHIHDACVIKPPNELLRVEINEK
jgi:dATP pyrophosphohydrolase